MYKQGTTSEGLLSRSAFARYSGGDIQFQSRRWGDG